MIEWIVKKVVISKVNDLLKTYKKNVDKAKEMLKTWTTRLQKVLACLEKMLAKLDDNIIDAAEIEEASEDVAKVIKEW